MTHIKIKAVTSLARNCFLFSAYTNLQNSYLMQFKKSAQRPFAWNLFCFFNK